MSRFGVPAGTEVRTPCVALPVSATATRSGPAPGLVERYSAAAPATCGEAIDVPLIVLVALSLPIQAEVIATPGASMSTQEPVFEKEANISFRSLAATVSA